MFWFKKNHCYSLVCVFTDLSDDGSSGNGEAETVSFNDGLFVPCIYSFGYSVAIDKDSIRLRAGQRWKSILHPFHCGLKDVDVVDYLRRDHTSAAWLQVSISSASPTRGTGTLRSSVCCCFRHFACVDGGHSDCSRHCCTRSDAHQPALVPLFSKLN